MTALGKMLLALGAVLGLVSAFLFGTGDRQVLVPPPEAVTEGSVRQMAAGRFPRAMPYLSEEKARTLNPATLKAWTLRLEERPGSIEDVRGEPESMRGDHARASAVLKMKQGEKRIRFGLSRSQGVWSIDNVEDLKRAAGDQG